MEEMEVFGMVYTPEKLIWKGMSPITAVCGEVSFRRRTLFCVPPPSTCGRSGREREVSDMTSSEVSMSRTAGDWGVEPMPEREKHMPRNQP